MAKNTNELLESLQSLHDKVDIIAMADNSDMQANIENILKISIAGAKNAELISRINSKLSGLVEKSEDNKDAEILLDLQRSFGRIESNNAQNKAMFEGLRKFFESKQTEANTSFFKIGNLLDDIKKRVNESISSADYIVFLEKVQTLEDSIKEVSKGISSDRQILFNDIRKTIGQINEKIADIKDIASLTSNSGNLVGNIMKDVENLGKQFAVAKSEFIQTSKDNFDSLFENFEKNNEEIAELKQTITNSMTGYLNSVKDMFDEFADDLAGFKNSDKFNSFDEKLGNLEKLIKETNKRTGEISSNSNENVDSIASEIAELKSFIAENQREFSGGDFNNSEILERLSLLNDLANFNTLEETKLEEIKALSENYGKYLERLSGQVETTSGEIFSNLEQVKDDVNSASMKLDLLKNDFKEGLESNLENITDYATKIKQDIIDTQAIIEDNNQQSNEKFSQLEQTLRGDIAQLEREIGNISGAGDIDFSELSSEITDLKVLLGENIRDNFGQISVAIADLTSKLENLSLDYDGKSGEFIGLNENIVKAKDELQKSLHGNFEIVAGNINSLIEKIESIKDDIAQEYVMNHSNLEQVIADNLKSNENFLDSAGEKFVQEVAILTEKLEEAKIDLSKDLSGDFSAISQNISGMVEKFEEFKTFLAQDFLVNQSNNDNSELISELGGRIEKFSDEFKDELSPLQDNLKLSINNLGEKIEKISGDVRNEISPLQNNLSSSVLDLDEKIENAKSVIATTVQVEFGNIEDDLKTLLERFESLQTDLTSLQAENNIEFEQRFIEKIEAVRQELSGETDNAKSEIEQNLKNEIASVKFDLSSEREVAKTELQNTITMKIDEIKNSIREEFLLNKSDSSEEIIGNLTAKIESITDSLKEGLTPLREGLDLSVENLGGRIDLIKSDLSSEREVAKAELEENIAGKIAWIKSELTSENDEKRSQLVNEIVEKLENLKSEISENYLLQKAELENRIFDKIESVINDFTNSRDEIGSNLEESFLNKLEQVKSDIISDNFENRAGFEQIIADKIAWMKSELASDRIDAKAEIEQNIFNKIEAAKFELTNERNDAKSQIEQLVICKIDEIKSDILSSNSENNGQIQQKLVEIVDSVKSDILSTNYDARTQLESNLVSKLDELSENIKQNILSNLNTTQSKLEEKLVEIFNGISDNNRADNSEIKSVLDRIDVGIEDLKNDIISGFREDIASITLDIASVKSNSEDVINSVAEFDSKINDTLDCLNNKIADNIKTEIEPLKENLSLTSDELKEKIDSLSIELKPLHDNIAESNESLTQKVSEFSDSVKDSLKDNFNNIAQSIGSLLGRIEDTKNKINENYNENQSNLEQSFIGNLKVAESHITSKSEEHSKIINEKLENINDVVNTLKSDLALIGGEKYAEITEKLDFASKSLQDLTDEYRQNSSELKQGIENYVYNIDKISSETNSKLNNTVSEFADLKSIIADAISKIDEVKDVKVNEIAGHLVEIIAKFDDINGLLKSTKEETSNNISEIIKSETNEIETKFSIVTDLINEFKANQNDNKTSILSDLSENFESVKQELNLINTDITSILNDKTENIIKNFEPLSEVYEKYINLDVNSLVNDIKNQIEANYLNYKSDLAGSICELQSGYDKIDDSYKDLIARCDKLEEVMSDYSKETIDLINQSISTLDTNLRSNLEQTNSLLNDWDKQFERIEAKINEFNHSHEQSLIDILEEFRSKLEDSVITSKEDLTEKLLDSIYSGKDDIKDYIHNLINLDDIVYGIGNIESNVNSKFDLINQYLKDKLDEQIKDLKENFGLEVNNIKNDINNNLSILIENSENSFKEVEDVHNALQDVNTIVSGLNLKLDVLAENNDSEIIAEEIEDIKNTISNSSNKISQINTKLDVLAENNDSEIILTKIDLNIDTLAEQINEIGNKSDKLGIRSDKFEELLNLLHEKVDILATADDSNIQDEIEKIKEIIQNEQTNLVNNIEKNGGKVNEIKEYLEKLLDSINKIEDNLVNIDLKENTKDIKDSIMSAILTVSDQISFVEETEEIKGFVESKTEAINEALKEVKKQINGITSSDSDLDYYSYTLQDVETDIAKLRLLLNDISSSNNSNEVSVISANMNRIANSVEELQNSMNETASAPIQDNLDKMSEDLVSLSTRTNKLLLNSDESYKILCNSLDEFSERTNKLEEHLTALDEGKLRADLIKMDKKLNSSLKSTKVLENVMMYLGEWMDATTQNITSIYDKTEKADKIHKSLLDAIEEKFKQQDERIDRLEKNLEKAVTILEEKSSDKLETKLDKLEKKITKLASCVEKLASYVDE